MGNMKHREHERFVLRWKRYHTLYHLATPLNLPQRAPYTLISGMFTGEHPESNVS